MQPECAEFLYKRINFIFYELMVKQMHLHHLNIIEIIKLDIFKNYTISQFTFFISLCFLFIFIFQLLIVIIFLKRCTHIA